MSLRDHIRRLEAKAEVKNASGPRSISWHIADRWPAYARRSPGSPATFSRRLRAQRGKLHTRCPLGEDVDDRLAAATRSHAR